MKITIFALLAAIILAGCTGTPVVTDSHGNILPEIKVVPAPDKSVLAEYQTKPHVPQVNPDGSVTVFKFKGFPVKMMPMTDSRPKGAIRPDEEIAVLIAQYEAALKANPKDFEACIMLAGLYIDRNAAGDADQAIRYSTMALSLNGDDPNALYARSLAYIEKGGNSERALNDLQNVLKLNVQSVKGVYYLMGGIYARDKKIDQAIDAFERVAALDPNFIDTKEILESLYKQKN